MDNYFQNIYRPILRTAEQTDTRAAITRHQQDREKHKQKERKSEPSGHMFGDDVMSVSLDALAGLLKDLLAKSTLEPSDSEGSDEELDEQEENKEFAKTQKGSSPVPSRQSKAATKAYQHAAETREVQSALEQKSGAGSTSEQNAPAGESIPAAKIDTDRVAALLEKVQRLKSRGLDEVEIEDRGNFLVSIEQTIDHRLND